MNITNIDQFEVRLTKNEAEVLAAQKLRYRVFVEEFGAKVALDDNVEFVERDIEAKKVDKKKKDPIKEQKEEKKISTAQ